MCVIISASYTLSQTVLQHESHFIWIETEEFDTNSVFRWKILLFAKKNSTNTNIEIRYDEMFWQIECH